MHRLSNWSNCLPCNVLLDCIVALAQSAFKLVARSHLQGFTRSYRGSGSINFRLGYAVSPATYSSTISWLKQHQLSDCLPGPICKVFLTRAFLQNVCTNWLRGIACKVFIDRIVAHSSSRYSSAISGLAQHQFSDWSLGLTCL